MLNAPQMNLLYVDDEEILLDITKRYLPKMGNFNVETAASAWEALKLLQQNSYDAIISDYQMPGMDGIAFLEHLRNNGHDTPFLLFTGKGREEVAIQALNAGADFYIQKGGKPKAQFAELANSIYHVVEKDRMKNDIVRLESQQFNILNSLEDTIVYTDLDHRILWINKSHLDFLGVDLPAVQGKFCHEVFWKKDQQCSWCKIPEVLVTGNSVTYELEHPDGNFCQIKINPVKTEKDKIIGFISKGMLIPKGSDIIQDN